ncbi:MAG TPA: hypothetical protein VMD76_13185 [Candidatus Sulfotelmatobacter sp.]|jgi:hypothetical protein|nr:hypothetical protein [Candidatus Sulfotelmatobacter sp.]
MVSKCANPECLEPFLYLNQGKLFHLKPTPEIESSSPAPSEQLHERFWLCSRCAKRMTLIWDGTQAKLVPLREKVSAPPEVKAQEEADEAPRKQRAHATHNGR